jgi:ERCC4-type nuclease
MKVLIDHREQDRVKSATNYYSNELKLDVNVQELPVGDYIFTDGNNSVCFEYKEVNDFITSISNHRVFNQAINMAEEFDYHFVVIRGTESERAKYLAISKNYQTVTVYQYLGAIASLNRYTTVIESYTPYINEAYYRMYIQAKKCLQDKPIVRKFQRKDRNPALNFLTYCIYGLNYKRSRLIVDTYDLHSLHDLMTLTPEMLMEIEGIGESTSRRILEALKQ